MLHQVGVSFDLYYDARKHKIKRNLGFMASYQMALRQVANRNIPLKYKLKSSQEWSRRGDTYRSKLSTAFVPFTEHRNVLLAFSITQ